LGRSAHLAGGDWRLVVAIGRFAGQRVEASLASGPAHPERGGGDV
jgi:hypothetical protein